MHVLKAQLDSNLTNKDLGLPPCFLGWEVDSAEAGREKRVESVEASLEKRWLL